MKKQLFEINAITNIGKIRKNNEDNFFVNDFFLSYAQTNSGTRYQQEIDIPFVAGISDGMGGESFGEEAAFITASSLYKCFQRYNKPLNNNNIKDCIDEINRNICTQKFKLGATLAMVYVYGKKITAVSIGDSRIYLYSKGQLKQISKDHTLAQIQVDAGLITRKQAKESNLRFGLTQFLGIPPEEMRLEPDFNVLDDINSEDIILICSDGLTEMVDDNLIENILSEKTSAKNKTEKLINTALDNGGKDNVTVMTIQYKEN